MFESHDAAPCQALAAAVPLLGDLFSSKRYWTLGPLTQSMYRCPAQGSCCSASTLVSITDQADCLHEAVWRCSESPPSRFRAVS